jgi:hypothetical protein
VLWLRSSASLCPTLLQLLLQPVGLDQHILRVSKFLLPLVEQPAKVCPVSLLALRKSLDQSEVDFGAVAPQRSRGGLPRLAPVPSDSHRRDIQNCVTSEETRDYFRILFHNKNLVTDNVVEDNLILWAAVGVCDQQIQESNGAWESYPGRGTRCESVHADHLGQIR